MIRIPVANLDDLQPDTLWCAEVHNRHNACKLLCVSFHMHSHQQTVSYQVQGGKDAGRYYSTTLLDFLTKFKRYQEPAAEPVGKEADMSEKGSGV